VEAGKTYRFSYTSISPTGGSGNLLDDASFGIDQDGDSLLDYEELALGTNPSNPDSDNDGLKDGEEVITYGTNPLLADTDGDGAPDGVEVTVGTNPKQNSSLPKPAITLQPESITNTVGGGVTFSVTATNPGGSPSALTYQWYKNGEAILTGTNPNLIILPLTIAEAGNYTVVVSNSYGAVTSSIASLTVNKANPTITVAPTATPIVYGQTLAFSTLSGGEARIGGTRGSEGTLIPGTFAFSNPAAAPATGTTSQNVIFTPEDRANYNEVMTIPVSVTVNQATQTITGLAAMDSKIYGAVDYTLSVSKGASTSALTYASSAPGVATINSSGLVSIKGAGTTTLTVNQAADPNYAPATPVSQTLTVGKAGLTIRADDKSRGYGAANPALTVSVVGAVRGESFEVTASTTATATSTPGSYSIEPDITGAGNYTVSKINGTLTVTSAPFAGEDTFTAAPAPSTSTKYSFAQLLANDRTYSGTTLSITGVARNAGTQGTVSTKGSWVVYVPKAGATALDTDSFSYTLSNGTGTTTTGTVIISLVSPDMTIEVELVSQATPANGYKATFLVMPGLVFEAYGSDTPGGTYTKIGTTTSASSGKLEVTDTAAAGKISRFYKLKWIPQ
jgi:hypothetical protein